MNILLLTADDMNGDTPGCCGGPAGVTPAIDALAAQGVLFQRAHVPVAICQPSRSAMMTGRWPHRNGAEGFQPIRDDVPVLTDLLRPAGYRVGILGKVDHLAPVERFHWDMAVPQNELGLGRDPSAYAHAAAEFIRAAADEERSWFLMVNAHDPHRPFHGSADELRQFGEHRLGRVPAPSRVFAPNECDVPGFLPGLGPVQREIAEYLSSSRRCDDVVDATLRVLESSGQADRTVVVFLSDNGMAFPFAKANCYLHGTRTPLVVRYPGAAAAGRVDETHFVSALDLFPTFCEAAGIAVPPSLDGSTLTGLLAGGADPARDHVVTVFHENWGKQRFEMRCIQDASHGYIWNHWADGDTTYFAEHMLTDTWRSMEAAADTDAAVARRRDFYLRRPREELYGVRDTDSLTNLAANPDHADALVAMRDRLLGWMHEVQDPLVGAFRVSA